MSTFKPTPHPVLELPSPEVAMELGSDGFRELMVRRERCILAEKNDPFGKGWEPPIWRVCDALLGFPWVDAAWADRMRRHLGFEKPVDILLINGGQRAGKSQYAAKRAMRVLRSKSGARVWALHSTIAMSRQYQQPIFYQYLPAELKLKDIRDRVTYITYKQKTGFSEEQFVLPPHERGQSGSDCVFKAYEQDVRNIEGGNLDLIWPDELVPPDWVETMELRIAEKHGKMIITFTPVEGYTNTVQLFQDGATVAQWTPMYLCPKDGGPPDVARALGLTEEELKEARQAEKEGRAARCPQSRPEECNEWLQAEGANNVSTGETPAPPRQFESAPRVLKCAGAEGKRAVVFFHSRDNPYGNPKEVWNTIAGKSPAFIKERFYGIASKAMTARFPKFDERAHVVSPQAVPKLGTRYHKVDPSSGRNFFMLWGIVTPEGLCIYREWPGSDSIPGIGVPGPWALPDGKKRDGRPGPGQQPFGLGNLAYKLEMARLEGWKDFDRDRDRLSGGEPNADDKRLIAAWDETNGAREVMRDREMDARFASTPRNENDRPTTLLTDFEDIGVFFHPAPAGDWADGIQKITDALDFDADRPLDFYNKPRLTISADCKNLIYALRTWTFADGQKGATKDPIETLRWFLEGDNPFTGDASEEITTEEEEREEYPAGSRVLSGGPDFSRDGRHY